MSLLNECNTLMIPSGYKAGTIYNILPNIVEGDFDISRNLSSTRINSSKYIEEIGIDIPRLDYLKTICPILETHNQYIQYIIQPIDFENSYWTKLNTIIETGFTSPYDDTITTDAYKLIESGNTETHRIYNTITTSSSQRYTSSIYAKKGERNWISCKTDIGSTYNQQWFDLDNGVIGSTDGTFDDMGIQELTGGWYRCWVTKTETTGSGRINQWIIADEDLNDFYTGDGVSGLYIYGANFTKTNYPAPYNKIESITTISGDTITNASYTGTSESGVFYVELSMHDILSTLNNYITISDDSTNNFVAIRIKPSNGYIEGYIKVGNVLQSLMNYTITLTNYNKIGVRWAENDFSLWINGEERATDTSGVTFGSNVLTKINFNDGGSSNNFYGNIKELATYNYLTDEEMIELTT